jgi:hypothetical protein
MKKNYTLEIIEAASSFSGNWSLSNKASLKVDLDNLSPTFQGGDQRSRANGDELYGLASSVRGP